jgi:hypothetical protein
LDINSGEIKGISEDLYNKTLNYLNISDDPFTYTFGDSIKKLFFIHPYSDYLPANYKHKYNGTYINNGSYNIRISRVYDYFTRDVFWLEDGQYVIFGSYIYATSGKIKETKIVDGRILAVY